MTHNVVITLHLAFYFSSVWNSVDRDEDADVGTVYAMLFQQLTSTKIAYVTEITDREREREKERSISDSASCHTEFVPYCYFHSRT